MGKAMPENLIPTTKRSPEDVKRITTMGGKASGESRRKRKLLRECLEELLARKWDTEEGKKRGDEAASIALMKKVLDGDTKAFEILRDTIGEKPVERVESNTEIVVNWSDDDNG